jgi:hypothetical protein
MHFARDSSTRYGAVPPGRLKALNLPVERERRVGPRPFNILIRSQLLGNSLFASLKIRVAEKKLQPSD